MSSLEFVTVVEKDKVDSRTIDYQIAEAVNSCEARIENGAEIYKAFEWLREEIDQIQKGHVIYE